MQPISIPQLSTIPQLSLLRDFTFSLLVWTELYLSMTRFPSLKRMPVHMSQYSWSVGWVKGPKTSPMLEKERCALKSFHCGCSTVITVTVTRAVTTNHLLTIPLQKAHMILSIICGLLLWTYWRACILADLGRALFHGLDLIYFHLSAITTYFALQITKTYQQLRLCGDTLWQHFQCASPVQALSRSGYYGCRRWRMWEPLTLYRRASSSWGEWAQGQGSQHPSTPVERNGCLNRGVWPLASLQVQ